MRRTRTPLESRLSLILWFAPYGALAIVGILQTLPPVFHAEIWQTGLGGVAIVATAIYIVSVLVLARGWVAFGSRSKPSTRRERDELWEFDLGPEDARGSWLVKYLPRLREARRQMRPDVVPDLDLPFTDGPIDLEAAFRPAPAAPRKEPRALSLRSVLASLASLVLPIVAIGCLAASGSRVNADLHVWAVLGATYVVYTCLMIGWLWELKAFPVVFLMAMTSVIMVVESWLAGWTLNGHPAIALTIALSLPATPIVLALLLARVRDEEPGPEKETTPGHLLRIKRRLHFYPGAGLKVHPMSSPTTGDRAWDD